MVKTATIPLLLGVAVVVFVLIIVIGVGAPPFGPGPYERRPGSLWIFDRDDET